MFQAGRAEGAGGRAAGARAAAAGTRRGSPRERQRHAETVAGRGGREGEEPLARAGGGGALGQSAQGVKRGKVGLPRLYRLRGPCRRGQRGEAQVNLPRCHRVSPRSDRKSSLPAKLLVCAASAVIHGESKLHSIVCNIYATLPTFRPISFHMRQCRLHLSLFPIHHPVPGLPC